MDAKTVGQAVWDHVTAYWNAHDCATETSHGPHQCDRSCGADISARLASAELDDLLARFEDFARSGDGAGSLQSSVVTRLVEAAVGVLVASGRLSQQGRPRFHVAPCRWADAVGDLPPFGEFGCTCGPDQAAPVGLDVDNPGPVPPRPRDGWLYALVKPHEHAHSCETPGTTHYHGHSHVHELEHMHEHEHPTEAMVEARLAKSRPEGSE